jgi:hypothetical protein
MSELQIKLMHREALKRLHDAERLDTDMVSSVLSDSGYLLDLLAFELLLKAVTLIHATRYKQNHNYEQLFESLPVITKNRIISRGTHWSDQNFCWPHLQKLLMLYSNNFIKMRYPFECYKNMDESEYINYGKLWVELGAPLEEAEFQYYHKELNALNKALLEEVENYLANK